MFATKSSRVVMAVFFSIVLFSCVAACAHAVFEQERKAWQQAPGTPFDPAEGETRHAMLRRMEERVLVILAAGCLCAALMSAFWARHAGAAGAGMVEAARAMARGNLDVTFSADNGERAPELAQAMNELAANFQELLLFVWHETGKSMNILEAAGAKQALLSQVDEAGALPASFESLRKSLDEIRGVIASYEFYGVSLSDENGRVWDKNDKGKN